MLNYCLLSAKTTGKGLKNTFKWNNEMKDTKYYNRIAIMLKITLLIILSVFSISLYASEEQGILENETVRLTFAGDIMTHPINVAGKENGEYKMLTDVEKYLKGDIVFGNLEFVVDTKKRPMKYPRFNGTREYLEYFSKYFNMFSVANNHFYDQGPRGANNTIAILKENKVSYTGGSCESAEIKPFVTNIKGITIAISAYTMLDNGLSGIKQRKGCKYYMNYYPTHKALLQKIKKDFENIPENAVKIVSLHYGQEWTSKPEKQNITYARKIINTGIDIFIGHHPHVLRPIEFYKGKERQGIIFYSLGNFFSVHKYGHKNTDIGCIASVIINKEKQYAIDLQPTYTYRYKLGGVRPSKVIPLHFDEFKEKKIYRKYLASFRKFDRDKMKNGYKLFKSLFAPALEKNFQKKRISTASPKIGYLRTK